MSPEAIDLIKRMMSYDPTKRISATQALSDPWILKFTKKGKASSECVLSSMQNLKSFKTTSAMHKAVLSYMVTHAISKEEENKLRVAFEALDTNRDGKLSKEEVMKGLLLIYEGNTMLAESEADRIMKRIDINKNGSIDYNGKQEYRVMHRVLNGQHEAGGLSEQGDVENCIRLLR